MKCTLGHRGREAAFRYARAGRCGTLWPVLCFVLLLGFLYPVAPAVGQGKIMQAKVQIVAPDPANPSQTVTIYDDGGVDDYTAPDVTSVFPLYLVVRLDEKEPILNDESPAAFPKPASGPSYNISIGNPGMLASGGGTFYGDRRKVQSHPELLTNYKFARWSCYTDKITGQDYGGRKIYAFTYPALYPGMVLSIKDNRNPLTKLLDAHETGSSYLYEGTDPNSHVKRMAHVVKGEYRLLDAMGGQVKKDWTSFFEWNNSYGYCTAVLPESSSWDFRSNNVPLFASRKLLSHQAGACSFDFAGITGDVILELRFTLGDRPEQRVDFLSNGAVNSRVLLFTPEVNFDMQTNINFPSKGTKCAEVPVWFPILNKSGDLVVAKEATGYHFLLGTYLAIEKPAGVPTDWDVYAGGWPEAGGSGGKPIGKELTIRGVN